MHDSRLCTISLHDRRISAKKAAAYFPSASQLWVWTDLHHIACGAVSNFAVTKPVLHEGMRMKQ